MALSWDDLLILFSTNFFSKCQGTISNCALGPMLRTFLQEAFLDNISPLVVIATGTPLLEHTFPLYSGLLMKNHFNPKLSLGTYKTDRLLNE